MDGTGYIGLGSNLGDRRGNLAQAIRLLATRGVSISATSRLFESQPMYVEDQPEFLNAVAKIETDQPPELLLDQLLDIEAALHRRRSQRFGPRTLDLDLLLWGERGQHVIATPRLTIPHPRLLERSFVLVPLAEVAGELIHPLCNQPIAVLAERIDRSNLECVAGFDWVAPSDWTG